MTRAGCLPGRSWVAAAILVFTFAAAPAKADPHELLLPLHEGKLHVADLSATLCRELHLPKWKIGSGDISVEGIRGSLFIQAVNASLGDGCRVTVADGALVLHFDPDKLPHTVEQTKVAVRDFVATETPEATAAQARQWGMFLPPHVDPSRHLVVLVHGLHTGCGVLQAMGNQLDQQGFQVAYFGYPADQPIADSAKLLTKHLQTLRETYPGLKIDIVAHSMGGLVARSYVEGDAYAGDVDHLIMVGTPNSGSRWAKYHLALEVGNEFQLWRSNPDWHWSWMITDGMGEAAHDLKPNSKFLRRLNANSRRDGVKYTIIAGNRSAISETEADLLNTAAHWVPDQAKNWFALGAIRRGLEHKSEALRAKDDVNDGPVSLRSAKLKGVDDFVVLPADHGSLFCAFPGQSPAALETIVDRLGK